MRRYPAGILAALVMTALLAAPAQGQTTTPAHVAYADEVNSICKASARRAKKINVRPSGDPVADFIRETVRFKRNFARTVKRISRVDRPPETADDIRDWIKGLRQQKRLIDRYIAAARALNGPRAIALGKRVGKVERRNGNRARRLDLNRCARR